MSEPAFIGGDWGTSRLRLFLCDSAGGVLARAEGPGVGRDAGDCAGLFAQLTAEWGKLPAVLSGMVGSTIGWREVPYRQCPVALEGLAAGALRFEADGRSIALLPGLSCINKSGAPDVMRGEETQIAGALRLDASLAQGRHLLCLPGTHTKWALIQDAAVVQFQTALSGELFDLLGRHSVLAQGAAAARPGDGAFALGLKLAREQRQAGLLHLLFSTRSRQLSGEIAQSEAASYLSGLIIGEDVAAAGALFGLPSRVVLVCAPALAALYRPALGDYGVEGLSLDGDDAARAGIFGAYRSLYRS